MFEFYKNWRKQLHGVRLEIVELQGEKKRLEVELETQKQHLANKEGEIKRNQLDMESKFRREQDETIGLLKLRAQQTEATIKNSYDVKLAALAATHTQDLARVQVENAHAISKRESELATEYYAALRQAIVDFTKDGTVTTQFMHDLAMKFIEKGPMPQVALIGSPSPVDVSGG